MIKGAGDEPILDVWYFRPGENFVLRMQEAATQADLTLALLSEAYLQTAYTQPEWAAAFTQDPSGKDRRLIPVRVGKCAPTRLLSPWMIFALKIPNSFGLGYNFIVLQWPDL
jgi:hypothetical protein